MDHGLHCAWTLPLILCILYNKQQLTCGDLNCYLANGKLDEAPYDINLFKKYILYFQNDSNSQVQTGSNYFHADLQVNINRHFLNSFKFHYCCQLVVKLKTRRECFLTHPGNTLLSVPQLTRFLKQNFIESGDNQIVKNLCQTFWRYFYGQANNSHSHFSVTRAPGAVKLYMSWSAHCLLITTRNSSNKLEYFTDKDFQFTIIKSKASRYVVSEKGDKKVGFKKCSQGNCSPLHRLTRQIMCEQNKFGQSCRHECHCALSKACNTSTGHCPNDLCIFGWQLPNCSVRICSHDTFLVYPKEECRPCGCQGGSTCHMLTGECMTSCESEAFCDKQTCRRHTYSPPNCNKDCYCTASSECHPVTGECRTESCSMPNLNPPTCSTDMGDVNMWETASALMILASFFLIKFVTFIIFDNM
ncbi:uncharacterized protein LOC106065405 [Biomphalaria glabrata]|uniref:Uncharacterized protein LOC106065405 n=1 Tax=Biomphalaria glabrata TaxID=6526 RepID=A0A9U8EA31_BIOGL|nr:uncharacterized protein LOC106065405 [Biomphalaria glabrata]